VPHIEKAFGHLPAHNIRQPLDAFSDMDPASYVKLGLTDPVSPPFEIIFHARSINFSENQMPPDQAEQKLNRNWHYDKWAELATFFNNYGYEMACIGDPRASYYLPHTQDRRGLSLDDLAAMLSASGWIIGPSSGPMHFATLCGCPQLVWGTAQLERRYKETWNPFKTFVEFLPVDESWDPSVDAVKQAFVRLHE
jgi:ADP-heptose:LPS heptosyltransferase